MSLALDDLSVASGLPECWPAALAPSVLAGLELPTPFLVTDLGMVSERFRRFKEALPRCTRSTR